MRAFICPYTRRSLSSTNETVSGQTTLVVIFDSDPSLKKAIRHQQRNWD
jgi:hypothetical protein